MYYGARYYHPSTRTFTSPDMIIPDSGNTQSYNRYAYVRNKPINYSDPTGLIPIPGNDPRAGENPPPPRPQPPTNNPNRGAGGCYTCAGEAPRPRFRGEGAAHGR